MADPMDPNPDFLSGIKTYESCLGKGGFGIVLKALDTSNTPSAIKFIFHDLSWDEDHEKRLREYNVPKNLEQHPNIVNVNNAQEKTFSAADIEEILKDIPDIDEQRAQYIARANARYSKELATFCIQMELCGENLRNWLNEGHIATDLYVKIKQTRIIQGVIAGLKYLHENKIINRDLKPENIMFSKGRYQLPVKIGDFGHSRRFHSEETKTGSLTTGVGTTIYMAPEMHGGDYDHQADLYSLGLIIFEVSQLIEVSKRRNIFDKLVNDKDEELVADHPIMKGIKKIIIGLTRRKITERTTVLDDINIDNWNQELLDGIRNQDCYVLWESISSLEKNLTVKTSQELKLCLDNALPGCIINLMNGEYRGPFVLNEDGVQIVGNGVLTVMKSDGKTCFEIVGSDCTISNVKIIKSKDGIFLYGSKNTIKQVETTDMTLAISIHGVRNTVDNVTMTNIEKWGIIIHSKGNTISNITGENVRSGIILDGSNNSLTNINFQRGTGDDPSVGVNLLNDSSHTMISNLTCIGYCRDKDDWGFTSLWGTSNCTVVDSACGPVLVWGNKNTFTNVDCGDLIDVISYEGVELINCRGKRLEAPKTVKISHCQFE